MQSKAQSAGNSISIAIIGAGPAGCATARSLLNELNKSVTGFTADSVNIYVFDPLRTNQPAIGESIPPAATPLMFELGVGEALDCTHIECAGSISLWGSDEIGFNDFYFFPQGRGYHLNRQNFNEQLINAVLSEKIEFNAGYVLSDAKRSDSEYHLTFQRDSGKPEEYRADYVIDASGISSVFSRRLGVCRNVLDQVISLCVMVEHACTEMNERHTLVEAVEDGWWYAAYLPNNKLIISFCSDHPTIKSEKYDQIDKWKKSLAQTRLISSRIPMNGLAKISKLIKRVAPSSILSRVAGDGWLAVGDAASSYDSISSAGITKALDHGIRAGKAIAEAMQGNRDVAFAEYQDKVFDDFNQYARLRYDIYRSEQRFIHRPFWLNRFQYSV